MRHRPAVRGALAANGVWGYRAECRCGGHTPGALSWSGAMFTALLHVRMTAGREAGIDAQVAEFAARLDGSS